MSWLPKRRCEKQKFVSTIINITNPVFDINFVDIKRVIVQTRDLKMGNPDKNKAVKRIRQDSYTEIAN